jgi:hypothetical protein
MDAKDRFGFLKGTTAEHGEFHCSRIMFCFRGDAIEVAQAGSADSHIEWFESEGWLTEASAAEFLENTIRGFYLPAGNELYCYKGAGWYFDEQVLMKLLEKLGELKFALSLNDETKLYLGPKDTVINGVRYKQRLIGALKDYESRLTCSGNN